MILVFLSMFIYSACLSFQSKSISKLKKTLDSKWWNLFIGFNMSVFIFFFIFRYATPIFKLTDLGDIIVFLFVQIVSPLANIIFLIYLIFYIGIISKKNVVPRMSDF